MTHRAADPLTFGFNGRLDPSSVSSWVEVSHRYHSGVFGLRFLQRTEGVTVLHGLLITCMGADLTLKRSEAGGNWMLQLHPSVNKLHPSVNTAETLAPNDVTTVRLVFWILWLHFAQWEEVETRRPSLIGSLAQC